MIDIRNLKYLLILLVLNLAISCNSTRQNYNQKITQSSIIPIKTLDRPIPDQQGIISYLNYQIFVSTGNETIQQIGKRLNIDGKKLALYNGLIVNYMPRQGEVLALPERILETEINTFENWSETNARQSLLSQEEKSEIQISDPNNPIRHRVLTGETAYSIARLYKVSVTSLAEWNGLGADLKLNEGREIIIPAAVSTVTRENKIVALTDENNTQMPVNKILDDDNSQINKIKRPIEETISIESAKKLVDATKIETSGPIIRLKPFIKPVVGTIANDYNPQPLSGEKKNNGIDYLVQKGSEVKAIGDGVIVLISEKAVGGSGKIILMKHEDDLISIYGGVDKLIFKKGSRIKQGDVIGVSAAPKMGSKPLIHFEIRQGMTSIDPKTLIED